MKRKIRSVFVCKCPALGCVNDCYLDLEPHENTEFDEYLLKTDDLVFCHECCDAMNAKIAEGSLQLLSCHVDSSVVAFSSDEDKVAVSDWLQPLHYSSRVDDYEAAAALVKAARSVLVVAGAGMSADSFSDGATFRSTSANPTAAVLGGDRPPMEICYRTRPECAWYYDGSIRQAVMSSPQGRTPHEGYSRLLAMLRGKDYFVLTTNIDDFFCGGGFDPARVCQAHGNVFNLQCRDRACRGLFPWPAEPELTLNKADKTAGGTFPTCPRCGGPARCNVSHMPDADTDLDQGLKGPGRRALQQWLHTRGSGAGRAVAAGAAAAEPVPVPVLVLEVGCGASEHSLLCDIQLLLSRHPVSGHGLQGWRHLRVDPTPPPAPRRPPAGGAPARSCSSQRQTPTAESLVLQAPARSALVTLAKLVTPPSPQSCRVAPAPSSKYRTAAFVREHLRQCMDFYLPPGRPRALDPSGGMFHCFRDDGSVFDRRHRHLVSSARFVFTTLKAAAEFPDRQDWHDAGLHAWQYLTEQHFDATTGGYAWTLEHDETTGTVRAVDSTYHCYGVAFAMLAHTTVHTICRGEGTQSSATAWVQSTWRLMEDVYWDAGHQLFRDEATATAIADGASALAATAAPDALCLVVPAHQARAFGARACVGGGLQWTFSGYRGQNANMHSCEALLAAYKSTSSCVFRERALRLAEAFTQQLSVRVPGSDARFVWEHYDRHWRRDLEYNRQDPKHLFRPWGFQPGHQMEWAKLLLQLHLTYDDGAPGFLVPTAKSLFDATMAVAWDETHGGLFYGVSTDGKTVCDDDKYFWVQAEAISAAAYLGFVTGEEHYWRWYDRLWSYCERHFVDGEHGAWFRILTADNRKVDDLKSPAGKVDYHTMGTCHDLLEILRCGV